MNKYLSLPLVVAATALWVSGCGGGGGGTTPQPPGGQPPPIPLHTFTSSADGAAAEDFAPNYPGASAAGTTVQVFGDEREGPVNAYDRSRRLTVTLHGPVAAGQAYQISDTKAPGTASVVYLVTERQPDGNLLRTGEWRGTEGTVNVYVADGSRVEGTFTAETVNPGNGNVISWDNGRFNVPYNAQG
jgi:hypothetical protein